MNKDAILATLIGLGLGLTIAGVFIFGPSLFRAFPTITFPFTTNPKTTSKTVLQPTKDTTVFSVAITAPLADTVEPKENVVVSGTTQTGATVFIQGPIDEDVVIAGSDGAYAGQVTAAEGKNDITVTAYDAGGTKQAQSTVTIYYTEENF